jgi:hypothetical protein
MLKKSFVLILCSAFFCACSEGQIEEVDNIETLPEYVRVIEYEIGEPIENQEGYNFVDSNSELWNENDTVYSVPASAVLTKSSPIPSYYTSIKQLGTEKRAFAYTLSCDSRLQKYLPYLLKKELYVAQIQIPKNSSLILPPSSVMNSYSPMGLLPTGSGHGYSMEKVRTTTTHDIYNLMTQIWSITHTLMGAQVASLNNPIYPSCQMHNPKDICFYYQYSTVDW